MSTCLIKGSAKNIAKIEKMICLIFDDEVEIEAVKKESNNYAISLFNGNDFVVNSVSSEFDLYGDFDCKISLSSIGDIITEGLKEIGAIEAQGAIESTLETLRSIMKSINELKVAANHGH